MIVKNEEKRIHRCLQSLPKGLIDYYAICDTGSTDGTADAVKDEILRTGMHYSFTWDKWENFGANKTRMLAEARKSGCDFILMMDADHVLDCRGYNAAAIKHLLSERPEDQFMIKFAGELEYRLPQLIRNNREWHYVGTTHEYLHSKETPYATGKFDGIQIIDHGDGSSRADKFQRDVQMLEEGLKQEPDNSRYLYYLAQSYFDMEKYDIACNLYLKRANQKGTWEEERWHAEYKSVCCREHLETPDSWKSIVHDYIGVWNQRPNRMEPITNAIRLCRIHEDYAFGWKLFQDIDCRKQTSDILFVERRAYDWELTFESGICAYFLGLMDEFKSSMEKTINHCNSPVHIKDRAVKNLTFLKKV